VKARRRRKKKDFAGIEAAVKRWRTAPRVDEESTIRKTKRFDLVVTDAALRFARKTDTITVGAVTHGIYVGGTSLVEDALGGADTARNYKSLSPVERGFRCIRAVDLHIRRV
jgi:hypothetical protein